MCRKFFEPVWPLSTPFELLRGVRLKLMATEALGGISHGKSTEAPKFGFVAFGSMSNVIRKLYI